MKQSWLIYGGLILVAVLIGIYLRPGTANEPEEVVDKNEPSITMAPPTSKDDLIVLESPREGERISSPLQIRGRARGNWFFEATFPVVLTDWDGKIIAEGFATAEGEWMTEEYVPFSGELEFEKPSYGERGSLILQKANPSGLPENDNALEITVYFE